MSRAPSNDLVNRRMATGLLLSLLLHALVLSLQFGMPGLGVPSTAPAIHITLAKVVPLAPAAEPVLAEPQPVVPGPPAAPKPVTGMSLLDPVPKPVPKPVPSPARPAVRKGKPSQARRISTPLPALEPVEAPTRVITQDQNPNDSFVLPLARPEQAVQKTVDPNEAQAGTDRGTDAVTAAAETEAAKAAELAEARRKDELAARQAAELKAAEEAARRQADEQARQDLEIAQLAARQNDEDAAARQRAELAARQKEEEAARQRAELAARQKEEEAARQRAEFAARQKEEEAAARQRAELTARQKEEQAARQRAELAARQKEEEAARQRAELAARQKEEEAAARQRAELTARQKEEEAARQRAELAARQKEDDAARQRAELAARQQADEAARQRVEEAARQKAEQLAVQQRERDRAAADARLAGNPAPSVSGAGPGPGAGASAGAGTAAIPKGFFSSDLANRARELGKGLDVLSGTAPPARARDDDERGRRRVIVGSAERDVPLRMYVDSFRQKIERNGGLNYSQLSKDRVRVDPLVSVAIRSDGSVEDVTIVRSSGRSDTDDAVRRIVRVNARYSAFPPNIAARYDVIEIRRIWTFDESLKLIEELR